MPRKDGTPFEGFTRYHCPVCGQHLYDLPDNVDITGEWCSATDKHGTTRGWVVAKPTDQKA